VEVGNIFYTVLVKRLNTGDVRRYKFVKKSIALRKVGSTAA